LRRRIAAETGLAIADGYIDRVEARIAALSHFPNRGTPRDDLVSGLRTLAFERRLVIAYIVGPGSVTVSRVIDAARDLGSVMN
jgi:toxin ParE1/3/4